MKNALAMYFDLYFLSRKRRESMKTRRDTSNSKSFQTK